MIRRIYVEKKQDLANEAEHLYKDIRESLAIKGLNRLRILNRYDVSGVSGDVFEALSTSVFAEPLLDDTYAKPDYEGSFAQFAVEYLPGQFDQRADSCAQCIQSITKGERPDIRTARVYILYGELTEDEIKRIKAYIINPVECREATLDELKEINPKPEPPEREKTLEGFIMLDDEGIRRLVEELSLAMDVDDLLLCREYFKSEGRNPTLSEVRVLDTYWSDHCRHTTFLTRIDEVCFFDDELKKVYEGYLDIRRELSIKKPVCLMDLATIVAKYLRAKGELEELDISDEVNACTIKIEAEFDGKKEPWLLLFKNETHNHPTEIEPFGGAATCIGGAIRDPLSGGAYVYAAMRVTGSSDPLVSISETLPGKIPAKKLTTTAAAGYSSYGNQIGIATGQVSEIYHPGYAAKRLETGAVIAAAPAQNVIRATPAPGDNIILLGGRTGRDGCGGATGSSKSHDEDSQKNCGAQVQKGNAPEERKLQRLFRNPRAAKLIKRCNDFGAGGVSVAIGELAAGVEINLDAVPKKYDGLNATELAISESQERMAVVISPEHTEEFLSLAAEENLEATPVATVTADERLIMRHGGEVSVNLSREFLSTNGAPKHTKAAIKAPTSFERDIDGDFCTLYKSLAGDLNSCSQRGLIERFDSTIGAGTVLMPLGGKYQLTPTQFMAHKLGDGERMSNTCSMMSWGYNPYISKISPYHGAYLAVVSSVSRLVAGGADYKGVYLSFQEFFGKPQRDEYRFGLPLASLLGAYKAQLDLNIAAIGGKDSMSGTFNELDVPPTLISFGVCTMSADKLISPEFKKAGSRVNLLLPEYDALSLPAKGSMKECFETLKRGIESGEIISAWAVDYGGVAEGVFKMCLGNGLGFTYENNFSLSELFGYRYCSFILELKGETGPGITLGKTTADQSIRLADKSISIGELTGVYTSKLEPVFPTLANAKEQGSPVPLFNYEKKAKRAFNIKSAKPEVLIPVFPGTNCEYESARAFESAGARANVFIIKNLSANDMARSIDGFFDELKRSQIVFLPGGFSAGDEPDGSGKFITAFFRNEAIKEATMELLDERGGLVAGICNGFQALIKLGLLPFGRIVDPSECKATLTYNTIGRHQSRIVRTRVCSSLSPWLANTRVGEIYSVPVSHGEGRFLADEKYIRELGEAGQIALQYVGHDGLPTMDIDYNPNGSLFAVEAISSPDGRVIGKMGHCERVGSNLYKNVPGEYDMKLFKSAVEYFR